jgi:hypothetical protein
MFGHHQLLSEGAQIERVPRGRGVKGLIGRATGDNVIPLSLTQGSKVPVRCDPENRKKLAMRILGG